MVDILNAIELASEVAGIYDTSRHANPLSRYSQTVSDDVSQLMAPLLLYPQKRTLNQLTTCTGTHMEIFHVSTLDTAFIIDMDMAQTMPLSPVSVHVAIEDLSVLPCLLVILFFLSRDRLALVEMCFSTLVTFAVVT